MLKNIAVAFIAVVLLSGCSSSVGKQTDNNKHIVEFERIIGDRIFFGLNSSSLTTEAQSTLMRQAEWLGNHKSFSIVIEGHCDERGTREYNIALGERRADSVKKFLVQKGVDVSRIDTISYGKERPAVIGNDGEAFAKNRRGVTAIR